MPNSSLKTLCTSWPAGLTLVGGTLISFSLGTFMSFGNIMPYLASYMRIEGGIDITNEQFIRINGAFSLGRGISMITVSSAIDTIGVKLTLALACVLFSANVASVYFTLAMPFWVMLLTYGFLRGFGAGVGLLAVIKVVTYWFPDHRALALAISMCGFGASTMIMNIVQTFLANPQNLPVDEDTGYFTDEDVLDRVPRMMPILAAIYFSFQLVGWLMTQSPRVEKSGLVEETVTPWIEVDSSRKALRHKELYTLYFARFLLALNFLTVLSYYKTFGFTFLQDDQTLAFVGSVGAISNMLSRPFFGRLADLYSYKRIMLAVSASAAFFSMTLPLAPLGGVTMFTIWMAVFNFVTGAIYICIPAASIQLFGQRYGTTIYGYVDSAEICVGLTLGFVVEPILTAVGWDYFFIIIGGTNILVFLTTLLLYPLSEKSLS